MTDFNGPRRPGRDFLKRYAQMEERVRRLEANHGKVHTEALTVSVLGDISVGMPLPPMVHSALDGQYGIRPAEQKSIIGVKAMCGIDGPNVPPATVTFRVDAWNRYLSSASSLIPVLDDKTLNCQNIAGAGGALIPHPGWMENYDPDYPSPLGDGYTVTVQITAVTGTPANLSVAVIVVHGSGLSPQQAGGPGFTPWA